ncbi:tRNA pseudouridine(55) synthase TruB [Candidatus Marimicrobium litorale]|uniref:tRNA pseudouridine synthase B n=1 Tax=Candidatus Marimicrobium litorale TaxID=2518991 RepID=A0ABT3T618_9GAMM|nr:tRNA pseudouridine(55) synthase TruB [Candidatus Marimicrobium litorale]MCX2977725.1 tRNA pseudouridine(55) synthase TruB [Candidatus Marimicrobium litorale]
MARRRRGRPVDGILVLDKPQGLSSNQALQKAKHLYFAAKAGHTGSLDPLATGVLPLCFGEATKFSQYLLDADKAYQSTFVLGVATASGDADSEVLQERSVEGITEAGVAQALRAFEGEIEQVPSMYSAIKQNGQPLYKLARQGIEVEREARRVVISALRIDAFRGGERPEVDIYLECSKGTYVRSLAEDLGKALGCGAHVSALRRTKAGPFGLEHSHSLGTLEALKAREQLGEMDGLLSPPDAALGELPLVQLSESGGFYMRQGQPVMVPNAPRDGIVRVALETGEFLGVGEILDDGRVAPRRLVVGH